MRAELFDWVDYYQNKISKIVDIFLLYELLKSQNINKALILVQKSL